MNLDDFIIACFSTVHELLPKLADSGMELVATDLGKSQDRDVFNYFRRHYVHFFPSWCRWLVRLCKPVEQPVGYERAVVVSDPR